MKINSLFSIFLLAMLSLFLTAPPAEASPPDGDIVNFKNLTNVEKPIACELAFEVASADTIFSENTPLKLVSDFYPFDIDDGITSTVSVTFDFYIYDYDLPVLSHYTFESLTGCGLHDPPEHSALASNISNTVNSLFVNQINTCTDNAFLGFEYNTGYGLSSRYGNGHVG